MMSRMRKMKVTAIAGDSSVDVNTVSQITGSEMTDKNSGTKAKGKRNNQRTNPT